MTKYSVLCCFCFLCCGPLLWAQPMNKSSFTVVPLGVKGGIDESNLSSYMLAPAGTHEYVCLDAGTIYYGLHKAVEAHVFDSSESIVLQHYIKGYLISHAHLDHVAGLIINSPDDAPKNIYGTAYCLNILRDKYFTWEAWANFANEGEKPALGKYHYIYLSSDSETAIAHTSMYVRSFPLSHGAPYQGTAFLLRRDSAYILYLGDTGADETEHSDKLQMLWKAVAPLIKAGQIKGIFIETSYPNEQPEKQLFGHLTPRLLMQEMTILSHLAGAKAMKGLPVLITHMKPTGHPEATIKKQLAALNTLQLQLIFPAQASPIKL
ncbi:MAG TPA: 3',5'-cyclic-nucleotide phosphodiesterase [Chitinophagaceae bacterium]